MEDQSPPPTSLPVGERSAKALRELHHRAHEALAAQRVHTENLEQQISSQLDLLQEEFLRQVEEANAIGNQDSVEAEGLRAQLSQAEESWNQQRQSLEEQLRQCEERLREQQTSLDERENGLVERQQQAEQQAQELQDRETANADTLSEIEARERQLDEQRQHLQQQESEFANQQQRLDERAGQLAQQEADIARLRNDYEQQETARTAQRNSDSTELETLRRQCGELEEKVVCLQTELADTRQGSEQGSAELQAAIADREQGFKEKEQIWQSDLAALKAERDKLAQALNSAAERLDTSRGASSERDELQQKFDLALADVQRLRERATELEQELARRPEPQEGESAELLDLRAERDALSERVSVLESQGIDSAGESDQQLSDLQRRFELAVEDVRQLKSENSELKTRISSMEHAGALDATGDGQNWEAQKQRLLASLEGSGEGAASQEERTSIEGTIRITDEVVAQKDHEISELRAQLEAEERAAPNDQAENNDPNITELLDADEIVQKHRGRLVELETELQDKLRTAEMELSLERAKIAREQTELAEWRIELEALRESIGSDTSTTPGQPKRRWLAKLGLGGDDDD